MHRTASQACFLATLLALAACAAPPADGRWVGTITPEPGSAPAPGCRGTGRSVLTVHGTQATFLPDESSVVLSGDATPDGHVRASRTSLGADKKPYVMLFEGQVTGTTLTGTYAAPRCRAKVDMKPL